MGDWKRSRTGLQTSPNSLTTHDSELEKTVFPTASKDEDTYAYNDADQMSEVKMKKSTEVLGVSGLHARQRRPGQKDHHQRPTRRGSNGKHVRRKQPHHQIRQHRIQIRLRQQSHQGGVESNTPTTKATSSKKVPARRTLMTNLGSARKRLPKKEVRAPTATTRLGI